MSAATFDDSLIPNTNNSFSLGDATYKWKDINISNLLNVGQLINDPVAGAQNGSIYYNTASNAFRGYASGAWSVLGGVGWAASSTNIYNTNAGNVGIGTANPLSKLQVQGDTYKQVQIGSTAGAFVSSSYFPDMTTLGAVINLTDGTDDSFRQSIFSYNASGRRNLGIMSRYDIVFGTFASADTDARKMVILNDGSVGIGTTAPAGPLHVKVTPTSSATGGTITYIGGYTIHTFTYPGGTFTPNVSRNVEVLVVAGGGGGGSSGNGGAGGGGAGGYQYNASLAVTAQAYTVTVGNGGAGGVGAYVKGSSGNNSVFSTITANGGGGGGAGWIAGQDNNLPNGVNGGSGGGAGYFNYGPATVGTGSQGYNGGQNGYAGGGAGGGGGGGSASVGSAPTNNPLHNGGVGGNGTANSISGASITYAAGGHGGGGSAAGAANSGNGGDGRYATSPGYAGGSGIVIVRYLTPTAVDALVVNSSGNVGIGTINPGYILDVAGLINAPQGLQTTDSYNKLLLHMEGSGTSFSDSATGKAVTAVGSATQTTAQYKFGSKSAVFNGSTDYLTVPDSADWDFGTGDFTIDSWVKFNSVSGWAGFVGQGVSDPYFYFGGYGGEQISFYSINSGVVASVGGAVTYTTNVWYHFAVVRNGDNLRIFKDGIQVGSTTTGLGTLPNSASVLVMGSTGGAMYLNGWIDEVRISKGIARWTSNFTPPTAPYGVITASDLSVSGNVGIGTASPGAKLDVNGAAIATSFNSKTLSGTGLTCTAVTTDSAIGTYTSATCPAGYSLTGCAPGGEGQTAMPVADGCNCYTYSGGGYGNKCIAICCKVN
ncbi:MAG: LamG-like jellyroll fold domain-containing protein [bacterium]|nr:LamG-like jellyroll fold domain-containing protein [bacterium]